MELFMMQVVKQVKQLFKLFIDCISCFFSSLHDYRLCREARAFHAKGGDKAFRYCYPLNESCVVFDIGGYEGSFAHNIYKRYKSKIYIFEPITSYYEEIKKRFCGVSDIRVFNYGISDKKTSIEFMVSDLMSSSVITDNQMEEESLRVMCELRDIVDVIDENNFEYIDLMKINIEGGEYDVLPRLIESGYIKRIKNLQIQFHRRDRASMIHVHELRRLLKETHENTYQMYFVWDNWVLKE
jgi:FkbM family methyltransferase